MSKLEDKLAASIKTDHTAVRPDTRKAGRGKSGAARATVAPSARAEAAATAISDAPASVAGQAGTGGEMPTAGASTLHPRRVWPD